MKNYPECKEVKAAVIVHCMSALISPVNTVFRSLTENYFSYFSTKTYVVGTQKNRLNETVLMSTQNKCLN